MWILTLTFNDTRTHRVLRLNSSTRVGRNNDYKKDPTCLYIADLKVPKTYITIHVGEQNFSGVPTPLSVRFESICTTDVNGEIYKLFKKEDESFEKSFTDDDLTLKVNANKSDRIRLRLRWVPVVVLPFSKKISYDGVVEQSPLPDTVSQLISAGLDIKTTDNPLQATHLVSLTDMPDYNLQVAVSRALPIVSSKWCDILASAPDDVDSWLFEIRPDLFLPDTRGNDILPNPARPALLQGKRALILTDDVGSKQALRLQEWLRCLSASKILVKNASDVRDLNGLENQLPSGNSFVFHVSIDTAHFAYVSDTNSTDDLWNAVVAVDDSKLRRMQAGFFQSFMPEKRPTDENREPTPLSQMRKRRKLERVEDTNFFSFTPLSSSKPDPDPESTSQLEVPDSVVSPHPEPAVGNEQAESRTNSDALFGDSLNQDLPRDDLLVKSECEDTSAPFEYNNSTATNNPKKHPVSEPPSTEKEDMHVDKKPRTKKWIVPEVSLADAIKSTKQQATDIIQQDLTVDDNVESQFGKLLVIEDLELMPRNRSAPTSSQRVAHNGKNFKKFRKAGPKRNNITRTFIELVDNGNAVYFKDSFSPTRGEIANERIQDDFATEMEEVRGFQPEPSQLFVNEASDIDLEQDGDSFQFSSRNHERAAASRSSSSENALTSNRQQADQMSEDENDNDVRFAFSRKV